MSPKKGRRVRKTDVPTDSVPEFELEDTAVIYNGGGKRGRQEKERKRHRNRGRRQGGRRP